MGSSSYELEGLEVYEKPDNGFGSWMKSRFRDARTALIPVARDLIKNSLAKEMKNHAQGELSFYQRVMLNIIRKYPGITLGDFLSIVDYKKNKIDSFLADKTTTTLDENLETALASVNIKVLVSDRINSLDMIKVEKIVLDVMAGQLWWINLFGGILGGLIGFAQVILSLVMR